MTHALAPAVAGRLLDHLPAVYREADESAGRGDLQALLAAFEAVLFGLPGAATAQGLEQRIAALPGLLAPDAPGGAEPPAIPGFEAATRDAVVPWIAARWVGFTPFSHFEPARLRRIVAGIVPLYARRGTPAYLLALLRLCFDELASVELQEHVGGGLRVGEARLGLSSLLGTVRPFTFRLDVRLAPRAAGWHEPALGTLHAALTAVIDFAKPAHTCCDLNLALPAAPTHAARSAA